MVYIVSNPSKLFSFNCFNWRNLHSTYHLYQSCVCVTCCPPITLSLVSLLFKDFKILLFSLVSILKLVSHTFGTFSLIFLALIVSFPTFKGLYGVGIPWHVSTHHGDTSWWALCAAYNPEQWLSPQSLACTQAALGSGQDWPDASLRFPDNSDDIQFAHQLTG